MTRIAVIGGSGYAGRHIVEAAVVAGHDVVSLSRHEPAEQIGGVHYLLGTIENAADRGRALAGAEVAIVAVSARGDMLGRVRPAIAELAAEAAEAGVRLGVIGGAGSLLERAGGDLLLNSPDFSPEAKPEATEMRDVLADLRAGAPTLDWFYVSPAATFGPWAAGEYTGDYRVGGDVLLTDDEGNSSISGADFGVAIVDEIESGEHRRAQLTIAY
ncbi:NAD(P)-dependent oxidoreductase [Leucobacter salsicius]|uniref:NAD(P)-dependent oxidoreductase n=1 Tax=Leucobacter salsicius TaxID=664638 RepID=UPI00034B456E|nr:NAD(P)H-binding protein [Leucobacter salsicius]